MLHGCVLWNALSASLRQPALFETSHIIGREDKRTNNKTVRLDTKNNGAAIYLGLEKIKLRKGCSSHWLHWVVLLTCKRL